MRRALIPVATLTLLVGCEQAAKEEPIDSFAVAIEARGGSRPQPDSMTGPAVRLVLPESAVAGTTVPIRIRVVNETAAPMDLYLRGREIAFDIVVTDSTGDDVWRRLEGEVVLAILQVRTLAPGEALELRHDWDQRAQTGTRVLPGEYGIQGTVLTDGQLKLISERATLRISPR